jgi:hypothetical protein
MVDALEDLVRASHVFHSISSRRWGSEREAQRSVTTA